MIGKFERRETKEVLGLVGKLTILRHGETTYTDKFPDLTDIGVRQAKDAGKVVKIEENSETVIISSPKARARGTMYYLMNELGNKIGDEDIRKNNRLRSVDIKDWSKAMDFFAGLQESKDPADWKIKIADKAFADRQFPPDIFESQENINVRIATAFGVLVRFFEKYKPVQEGKIPHIYAVSHFELLQTFASLLFSDLLSQDTYNLTEKMDIEFENLENKKVRLICNFRGVKRSVVFDRQKRGFVVT